MAIQKKIIKISKLLLSIALLTFVFYLVDIPQLIIHIKKVNIWLYILALSIAFFRIFISAFRWQRLLVIKNIKVPFSILSKYYLIASFYNLFLPTALGGDAIRIYSLAKYTNDKKTAISSIVIERLLGFLSLCVLGFTGLLFGSSYFQNSNITFILFLATFLLLIGLIVLLNKKLANLFFVFFKKLPFQRFFEKIEKLYQNFTNYSERKDILIENFLISLFYQTVGILVIGILGHSVGINASWIEYLIFVPIVWILIMLPISVSGVGLREGAFVYLFMLIGVEKELALLLSLMEFSQTVIIGSIGGIVQTFYSVELKKEI